MIPISYNLRSLTVRKATTIATAIGIALVVLVLAASRMLVAGIEKTLVTTGRADTAVVLRKGAGFEMVSMIEDPAIPLILVHPAVKKDGNAPIGVAEIVGALQMRKVGTDGFSNVTVRGIPETGMQFRPNMKVIAGEKAKPNTDEVIIGKRLRGRFQGLDVGQSIEVRKNRMAKIVGVFEDDGSSYESEILGDFNVLRKAFAYEGVVSSVRVRLESAAAFDGFKAAIENDKRLGFQVLRETEFYRNQSEGLAELMTALGAAISLFFSIGAMIGAMITMYGSVANRQKEIGTLRALGFPRSNILISFVLEAMILTVAGGVIGAVASLALGMVSFSMIGGSYSEVVFTFQPTPEILASAVASAAVIGLLAGFFPAVRAARVSPIIAMRGG